MKLSDLVKQAQNKLPLYTDYFSDKVKVISLTAGIDGKTCRLETKDAHSLVEGANFTIQGAKVQNKIVSLTQSHGLGRLVTEYNHQVTKNTPLRKGDSTHITIQGAEQEEYNGTFLIMDIPNCNVIEFSIDKNAPAEATGSPYITEDCYANFNGRQTVKEVIDENTVEFELEKATQIDEAVGDIYIRTGVRISGEYSIEHALEAYEQNDTNELWGFCVLDGANVSKSRVNKTDAIATVLAGADVRAELVQDFNFFVIIPTTSEYCWVDFVDLANELRKPIMKTFHRARLESGATDEDCHLAFVGDQPVDTTTKAFMVYQYKFQTTINVQNEDGVEPEFSPAIRSLDMYHKPNFANGEDTEYMHTEGDIPDEYITVE